MHKFLLIVYLIHHSLKTTQQKMIKIQSPPNFNIHQPNFAAIFPTRKATQNLPENFSNVIQEIL